MKGTFRIPPYVNLLISNDAMISVEKDTSDDPNLGKKSQNKIKVSIMNFSNGERRFVILLPVKNKRTYIQGTFPDPVLLYLESAHKMLLTSEVIMESNFPDSVKFDKDGDMPIYDATSDQTSGIFNSILQYRISSIIMLHAAVEAFINELIPDNISYPKTDKEGNIVYIGKGKVFGLSFIDKLKKVVPFVTNVDLVGLHSGIVEKIDRISQIRNGFVHLKSESSEVLTQSHSTTFHEMLKLNLETYFDAVHDFIEILKPEYIKYH